MKTVTIPEQVIKPSLTIFAKERARVNWKRLANL